MRKIIVFDFDHTLFSTTQFKSETANNLLGIGIPLKIIQETEQGAKINGCYLGFKKQVGLIKKALPNNHILLSELLNAFELVMENSNRFIYPDVRSTLRILLRRNYHLILLSSGERHSQRRKINNSGIAKYFQRIIVSSQLEKTKSFAGIFRKRSQMFYVEDSLIAIKEIKKKFPSVITIRVCRQDGAYSQQKESFLADFSVNDFSSNFFKLLATPRG